MTLAFFPSLDGLEWNITKRHDFKTSVFEALSGKESRVKLRQTPKTTFKLSYEFLIENQDEQQMTELMSFMLNRGGSYEAFLYSDPTDFFVTDHECGVTDGPSFQLSRTLGGFNEPVQNIPFPPTAIYLNGILQSAYTITDSGLISWTTTPPAGQIVTWTGKYYYRCRFLQDGYDFTQLMKDLYECRDIDFIGAVSNKV